MDADKSKTEPPSTPRNSKIEGLYHWIKRLIYYHGTCHPQQMNGPEFEAFLTHLARNERVAVATQDRALSTWLFL